ncbi:helix-turn-helix domain-containing protein, partial [Devosia naphthalenivorans]|uniref:helix-turn-helix domain-containing protein n=1 Tax=Devosia naphthalenivorans TaxID=2082392 RepID=UPI0019667FBA
MVRQVLPGGAPQPGQPHPPLPAPPTGSSPRKRGPPFYAGKQVNGGSLDSRHKCNTCYGVGAMGTLYEQLSLRERVEIDIGRRKGLSMQAIGQMLGRSASTISRELGRNGSPTRH